MYLMAEVRRVLGPVGEAPQAAFLELTPGVLDSVNRARNWLLEAGKQIGPEATAVSLNASVTWAYIEGFDPRDYDISGYCYVTEKPDPYWVRRPDPFIIGQRRKTPAFRHGDIRRTLCLRNPYISGILRLCEKHSSTASFPPLPNAPPCCARWMLVGGFTTRRLKCAAMPGTLTAKR